jgi:uncharacterized peroxidase-related enzyme
MAHIDVRPDLPGIRGLLAFRPDTGRALSVLADTLLHQPGALPPGERELIAAYVSRLNACDYCYRSHAAIAACHLNDDDTVAAVTEAPESAAIPEKLKALLAIAARVQRSGRAVGVEDVARARAEGASDLEIHDTVLIAAAFCMFNRYVDGLATSAPADVAGYRERAGYVATYGYVGIVPVAEPAADGNPA